MSETAPKRLARMFESISKAINDQRNRLSELDGAVGDGDHGTTMSIGFAAVHSALSKLDLEAKRPADVMSTAAEAFLNAVGASSGPLYSTGFRRAAAALGEYPDLDTRSCSEMIRGIALGITERGKAQRGDKTMLDVWQPAADAALQGVQEGKDKTEFWGAVKAAAESGEAATRSMVATKGRAAKLRERSLGHVDPGAASARIIVEAMAIALR